MNSSRRPGQRRDEARQRLTESLRANLVRRKIQQRERAARLAASLAAKPMAGAMPEEDHVPMGADSQDEKQLR